MKAETLRAAVKPFFDLDPSPLFVSICCGRMYIGSISPRRCRTCETPPSPVQVASLGDVDRVAAILPAEGDLPQAKSLPSQGKGPSGSP